MKSIQKTEELLAALARALGVKDDSVTGILGEDTSTDLNVEDYTRVAPILKAAAAAYRQTLDDIESEADKAKWEAVIDNLEKAASTIEAAVSV